MRDDQCSNYYFNEKKPKEQFPHILEPRSKILHNIDSNKCFQFYCHCKFLLFWSEDTWVELEYNKEWEIEDFLRGETMILHLQYEMEKTKEHFEIT